jgi:hypothetical protein
MLERLQYTFACFDKNGRALIPIFYVILKPSLAGQKAYITIVVSLKSA